LVLSRFLEEIYGLANPHKKSNKAHSDRPKRFIVQELAFMDDEKSAQDLQKLVLEAERKSLKLPIVRQAIANASGVKADEIVILDVVSTSN
jgi:ATP-dependent DNA ligase